MEIGKLLYRIKTLKISGVDPYAEISGITSFSGEVKPKSVFVCLTGSNDSGINHLKEAKEAGALLFVADRGEKELAQSGLPYVMVSSARETLARLVSAFCGNPQDRLCMIGVTGTNGKTTTVRLLSEIIRASGAKTAEIGTLTGNMTTPDCEELYPALREAADNGCSFAVMEVSSHSLFFDKVAPIAFEEAVFTNLSRDHLDLHKDMGSYARCKAKLFSKCRKALMNGDSFFSRIMSDACSGEKYLYSLGAKADFEAQNVRYTETGTVFDLYSRFGKTEIKTHLPGRFNVYNAAAAASAALLLGIDGDTAARAIESVKRVPGRMEKLTGIKDIDVYIDYAHTPDALENALAALKTQTKGKLTVVFGCGGDRDRGKRAKMGRTAEKYADLSVLTSDNDRSENRSDIISDIVSGFSDKNRYVVIPDRKDAVEYAIRGAEAGDAVLLAGKGHERYQIAGGKKTAFNEREIAVSAAEKRKEK